MAITRQGEFIDSGIDGTVDDVNTSSFGWSTALPIGDVSNTAYLEFNGNSSEIIQAEDLDLSGVGKNDETGTLTYSGVGNLPSFVTVLGTFKVFFNNDDYGDYEVSGNSNYDDLVNIATNTHTDDDNLKNTIDTFVQLSANKTTVTPGATISGKQFTITGIPTSRFRFLQIQNSSDELRCSIMYAGLNRTSANNGVKYNSISDTWEVLTAADGSVFPSVGEPLTNTTGTLVSVATGLSFNETARDLALAINYASSVATSELYSDVTAQQDGDALKIFKTTDTNPSTWTVTNNISSSAWSFTVDSDPTETLPDTTNPSDPDEAYNFILNEDAKLTIDNGRTFQLGNYLIQQVNPGTEIIVRDGATIQYTGTPKRYTDGAGLNQGDGSNGIGGTFAKPFTITLKDAQFRITDLTNTGVTPPVAEDLFNSNFFWSANGNSLRITKANFQDSIMYCNNNATALTNNMPTGTYNNFKIIAEGNGTVFLPINGNTKFLDNFIIEDFNSKIALNGATSNSLIQPDGTSFSAGTDAVAKAFTYPTQAVMYRMNLIGPTKFKALQNRSVNQIYINPIITDSNGVSTPYVDTYEFSGITNVSGASAGTATIGTQINNRWLYGGDSLHNVIESAYYDESATTLIPVLESHSAGTFTSQGSQYHPWKDEYIATTTFRELVGDEGGTGSSARKFAVEFDTDGTFKNWVFNVDSSDLANFTKGQKVFVSVEDSAGDITEYETNVGSINFTNNFISVDEFTDGATAAAGSPSGETSTDTVNYGNSLFWFEDADDIPTLSNQSHNYVNNTNGLADINYQGDNELVSQDIYKGVANDNNGYVATSLRTDDDETPGDSNITTNQFATSFDRYIRRNGFRPLFETVNFSDGEVNLDRDLVASLDKYWQETLISEIDKKVAGLANQEASYTLADEELTTQIGGNSDQTITLQLLNQTAAAGSTNNHLIFGDNPKRIDLRIEDADDVIKTGQTFYFSNANVSGTEFSLILTTVVTDGVTDGRKLVFNGADLTDDIEDLIVAVADEVGITKQSQQYGFKSTNGWVVERGKASNLISLNDLYRSIEYLENENLITNANLTSETRANKTNLNGRFIRFIDTETPVTEDTNINMPTYNLSLDIIGDLKQSTGEDSILGIDMGTNELTLTSHNDSLKKEINANIKAKELTTKNTDAGNSFKFTDCSLDITNDIDIPGTLTNVTINNTGTTDISQTVTGSNITSTGEVSIIGDIGTTDITTDDGLDADGDYNTGTLKVKKRTTIDDDITNLTVTTTDSSDAADLVVGGTATNSTGTIDGEAIVGVVDRCTFDVQDKFSANESKISSGTIRNEITSVESCQIAKCADTNVSCEALFVSSTSCTDSTINSDASAITQATSGSIVNAVGSIGATTVESSTLTSSGSTITTKAVSDGTVLTANGKIITDNIGDSTIVGKGDIECDDVSDGTIISNANATGSQTVNIARCADSIITSRGNLISSGPIIDSSLESKTGFIQVKDISSSTTLKNIDSVSGKIEFNDSTSSTVDAKGDVDADNISSSSKIESEAGEIDLKTINSSIADNSGATGENIKIFNISNNSTINAHTNLTCRTINDSTATNVSTTGKIEVTGVPLINEIDGTNTFQVSVDTSSSTNYFIELTSIIESLIINVDDKLNLSTRGLNFEGTVTANNDSSGTGTAHRTITVKFSQDDADRIADFETGRSAGVGSKTGYLLWDSTANFVVYNDDFGIANNVNITAKNTFSTIYLDGSTSTSSITADGKVTVSSDANNTTLTLDGDAEFNGKVTNVNIDCENTTTDQDIEFNGGYYLASEELISLTQTSSSSVTIENITDNSINISDTTFEVVGEPTQTITFSTISTLASGATLLTSDYSTSSDWDSNISVDDAPSIQTVAVDDANDRITIDGAQANITVSNPIKTSRFGESELRLEETDFSSAKDLRDIESYAVNTIDLPESVSENSIINSSAAIEQTSGNIKDSVLVAGTTVSLNNLDTVTLTAANNITLGGTMATGGTITSTTGDVLGGTTIVYDKIISVNARDVKGKSANDTTFNMTRDLTLDGDLTDCNISGTEVVYVNDIDLCPTISCDYIIAQSITDCPSITATNNLTITNDIDNSNITAVDIDCRDSKDSAYTISGDYTGTGDVTNTSTTATTINFTAIDVTNCPSINVKTKLDIEDVTNSTFNLTGTNTVATQSTVGDVTTGTFNVGTNHNIEIDQLNSGTVTGGAQVEITDMNDGTVKDATSTLITDLAEGTIENTNLTLTNPNTGNTSFNDVVFKDVQTNTVTTPYKGTFTNGCEAELDTSGNVFYSTDSVGSITLTKGPATIVEYSNKYSNVAATATGWRENFAGTRVFIDDDGDTTVDNQVITSGQTTFVLGDVTYKRQGFQEVIGSRNAYALTKITGEGAEVLVDPGSLTVTIEADDGTNYTDNITLVEDPFTFTVTNPDSSSITLSRLELEYVKDDGTKTVEAASAGNDIVITQVDTTKGLAYKITYTRAGFVWQLIKGTFTGLDQTITVPQNPNAYPSTVVKGTFAASTTNPVTIDSSNVLTVSLENVTQSNVIANRVVTEALVVSENTHKAIRAADTVNIFLSDGSTGGFAADSSLLKVISTTASSASTKETFPYFRPLQTDEGDDAVLDIFKLVEDDRDLGISTLAPELSVGDVSRTLNVQLNSQFNGRIITKENEERKGRLIPVDEDSTQDIAE